MLVNDQLKMSVGLGSFKLSRISVLWITLLSPALCVHSWSHQASPDEHLQLRSNQETFLAGTDALKRGDFPTAVILFQKVLETEKGFAPAYLNLGLAYHSSKQYGKAIEALQT